MFISLKSGARGLQRLICSCLQYYAVLKQKSRFTGLNAAENTDYVKK